MNDPLFEEFELVELVAVMWDAGMAQRFPKVSHAMCRQEMRHDGERWVSFEPVRCMGWHCNRCGAPTNSYGHHVCPDRPEVS